ncbi:MAG: putrescine aminotransferase [Oscillospiraceae bacterium]|nr:putrescine aminotransferase [Oscillospiraceae bacterium]
MSVQNAKDILGKVLGYIDKAELTEVDKKTIVEDSIKNFNTNVNPGWLEYRKSMSTNAAFIEWESSGAHFTDVYGEEFIDCLGGFGIYNFGHRNPDIVKYVQKQLNRYALHSQELVDPLRGYLASVMAEITPGDLQYCFFTNGGAEAVEMALKLARIASGKRWYISTVGGFHGKSLGAVSVGGKGKYRVPFLPMIQQVAHTIFGDIEDLRKTVEKLEAVGEQIAAVIMEPVQGEAGVIIPPAGYLKAVRELCDKHKIILIFDEIQTGMGRTGATFRCAEENVVPDIMTFGKAFGGGVMPITGIIARPHLWIDELIENPWVLGSPTFGGNPLACSASLAAISYMIEHDVPKQAKEKGEFMLAELSKLSAKYPKILKGVRGVGLLIAMEFADDEMGYNVAKEMFARRVMTAGTLNNSSVIRIEPPLVISKEDLEKVLARLDESLAETAKAFKV